MSPASTSTTSPTRRSSAFTPSQMPRDCTGSGAWPACRCASGASASPPAPLPRPSATASAKVANTVNHSHKRDLPGKKGAPTPLESSRIHPQKVTSRHDLRHEDDRIAHKMAGSSLAKGV